MEHMLAVLPRTPVSISTTPFYEFLAHLHANEPTPIANIQDGAIWSGPDLLKMSFDGLWVVMGAVANRHNLRMETEQDIWKTVAPIVNRLINVGLVLTGPKAAAEQFRQEVLKPVLLKLNARRGQTIENPATLWTQESMSFFAKLYKLGREKVEALLKLGRRIAHDNLVHKNSLSVGLISFAGRVSFAFGTNDYLVALDPDSHSRWGQSEPEYAQLLAEEQQLLQARALQKALHELPDAIVPKNLYDREDAVPAELKPTLDLHALRTQLLLAAGNRELDINYILSEDYNSLLEQLQALTPVECLVRFWNRLGQLGYTRSAPNVLSKHVAHVAQELRGYKPNLDLLTLPEAFIKIDFRQDKSKVQDEYNVERLFLMHRDKRDPDSGSVPNDIFLELILPRVAWEDQPVETILFALEHLADRHMHIALLKELSPKKRQPLLDQLAFSDPEIVNLFVGEGWFSPNRKLDLTNHEMAKDGNVFQALLKEAAKQFRERHTVEEHTIIDLLTCAQHVPRAAFQDLAAQPATRGALSYALSVAQTENLLPGKLDDLLPDLFGHELHLKLVLATEVSYRTEMYRDAAAVSKEDEAHCLPSWERLAHKESKNHPLIMGDLTLLSPYPLAKTQAYLKKHTEDEIFLWLHEASPEAQALLQTFVANRKAYYLRKQEQGFKVPAKLL